LALAKSHVNIAVYLFQAPPQLLDPIYRILDPTRQVAHLGLDPIHTEFIIDRGAGASGDHRAACTAIDLPLQHAEIPLQSIETVLHCSILRLRRLSGQCNGENHQQQC
jgi:hypothetical protein